MLLILLLTPILSALAIAFGSPARLTALLGASVSVVLAFVSVAAWSLGHDATLQFEVLERPKIHFALGLPDGLSIVMVLLSVIVMLAAVASQQSPEGREKLWYSSSLLIGGGALGAFLSLDVFFFYAFHELALIPTFLMIGLLGQGERREVAWRVTLYLAFGSIVLLAGILALVSASGSESLLFSDLQSSPVPEESQKWIGLLLLIGFGVLVSLFPFHSWAAPAYASAPTPTAMLHAGVLKKFGLYGLFRLYPTVSEGMQVWLGLLVVLLLCNIIWVGLITINQRSLDSLLGNSSVMHMGYIFLAFAALVASGGTNSLAVPAAALLMFAHGISIALLFLLARRIGEVSGTLEMGRIGGLAKGFPKLALLFGIAAMASLGLPGLANFAGEVLVFLAGFQNWEPASGMGWVQWGTVIALWGVVISAVYMLRALRSIFHGPRMAGAEPAGAGRWSTGFVSAIILAGLLLLVGLYPKALLQFFPAGSELVSPTTELASDQ